MAIAPSKADGADVDRDDVDAPPTQVEPWSRSVRQLASSSAAPMAAGEVVARLVGSHTDYLDVALPSDLRDRGTVRPVAEHAAAAAALWDSDMSPLLTGRRVIVAMALDPDIGLPMVRSGAMASLIARWRRNARSGEEPLHVVWDLLSPDGRALADEQPLLAAALGAPAEWSVRLPATASALAWAPFGDRLAFLADGAIHEVARDGVPRRLGRVGGEVLSLSWGSSGVTALCRHDDGVDIRRVPGGTLLGGQIGADDGRLTGDGSSVWLSRPEDLARGTVGRAAPQGVGPAARPLALDWSGRRALVGRGRTALLLGGDPAEEGVTSVATSDWPGDGLPVLGTGESLDLPCTLVETGEDTVVAWAEPGGGVRITPLGAPPWARIATGTGEIDALATDAAGTRVAVAAGEAIEVWPLALRRITTGSVPAFDTDQGGRVDLLGTDRDALALAGLLASSELKPPLAIGLFGTWGSGKSFLLRGIGSTLALLTGPGHAAGYLGKVEVVRFNAWQYAETNLWASIVDEVLRTIGSKVGPTKPAESATSDEDALNQARQRVTQKAAELAEAERQLGRVTRGRWLWAAAAVAVALVAAAVAAGFLVGASATILAGYGALLTALTAAVAAVAEIKRVLGQGAELGKAAGKFGEAAKKVAGLRATAEAVVVAKRAELQAAQQRSAEAERLLELATSPRLGAVLHRLASLTEYRDQLSLVTRTRDRFGVIDRAVTEARLRGDTDLGLERVVIMIDDLDRCPPEKVVAVLEAVHLLFDFALFVVVIAVDTRWLEQSLRIRHRQLLGETGGATPSDYLEKIIQIPLHLLPLGDDLIRGMIAGLTGAAPTPAGMAAEPAPYIEPATLPEVPVPAMRATTPRPPRPALPAETLQIGAAQAAAMSDVAGLIGSTPRTVKRFVNTYRLLKTRAVDLARFDERRQGIGDHEVVALLLAVVTGHPVVAGEVLAAVQGAAQDVDLAGVVAGLPAADPRAAASLAELRSFLTAQERYGATPATRFAGWVAEVMRFSFAPPVAACVTRPDPPGPDPAGDGEGRSAAGLSHLTSPAPDVQKAADAVRSFKGS